MTNSEVLQYIIQQLHESPLELGGDRELFELIFAPISYGNDIYKQRKTTKQLIINIFKNYQEFDKKRFNTIIDDLLCKEDHTKYIKQVINYINIEIKKLNITSNENPTKLIKEIPCKRPNYKNNFSNWKSCKMKINNETLKKRLEKNFDFTYTLWNSGDIFIKSVLKKNVKKFIINNKKDITDIFKQLRKEFAMEKSITKEEIQDLENIRQSSQAEVMEYIAKYYYLNEHKSQEFIQKLIPILYSKGYYELILHDVIDTLDIHIQENKEVKKIKAHILGSHKIGEYKKAFDLLSTISAKDDKELIDMRTEAISNMRRHQLNDETKITKEQKREILQTLISYYQTIFEHNETHDYYPAINLTYIKVIFFILYENNHNKLTLKNEINNIYKKAKESLSLDKSSKDKINQYYANISEIEFLILREIGNPIAELERYLESESQNIPLFELDRTIRQMQFLADTTKNSQNPITSKMKKAIELINDFINFIN